MSNFFHVSQKAQPPLPTSLYTPLPSSRNTKNTLLEKKNILQRSITTQTDYRDPFFNLVFFSRPANLLLTCQKMFCSQPCCQNMIPTYFPLPQPSSPNPRSSVSQLSSGLAFPNYIKWTEGSKIAKKKLVEQLRASPVSLVFTFLQRFSDVFFVSPFCFAKDSEKK